MVQNAAHDDKKLQDAIVAWIKAHRNANTSKAYSSSFKLFVSWCKEQNPPLPYDPPTEAVVAQYARHLVIEKDAAFSTVSTRMAAIADDGRYSLGAIARPPTRSVLVQQMLKCLRPLAKAATQKLALGMGSCTKWRQCCSSPSTQQLCAAARLSDGGAGIGHTASRIGSGEVGAC